MSVTPEFFRIDQNRLDEEWTNQAPTYYEYSVKLADAREEHERCKARRDIVEAELDRAIRQRPEEFGVEKVTEGVVGKTIILQKKYQQAHDNVIRAKHDLDIVQAAVDALEHKKKGLESMVYLQSQGYYAEPKGPRVVREKVEELEKRNIRSKGITREP